MSVLRWVSGGKYTEPGGMGRTGVGDVQGSYLQKGGQHGQAPWAPQGLVHCGKCSAEVNHVDLERTGG